MININNLSFCYKCNDYNTLNNINLNINNGECLLICGASGCGKSTLLQTINGIVPEQREGKLTGEIIIDGKDATKLQVKEKSRYIGSVFQNPKSQFFHLNTSDELFFACANHLISLDEMESRLSIISKEFNIEHLINRNIFKLSGGEKQTIAIASVSMNNPDIYVLDEPSSNLDEKSIEQLKNILSVLKSQGKTIIIAEHRLYYALEICDRVAYMKDGFIVREYKRHEFMQISQDDRKLMGLRGFTHIKLDDIKMKLIDINPSLLLENLIVKYDQKIAIEIDKIDLPIHRIIAITGDNGVGKSSFVRAFSGLYKTKGALLDKKPMNYKLQQKDSFMVMQDVNSQLYCESAIDELIHLTDESDEIKQQAKEVLKKLNLLEYQDDHPMVLSGGQKQRLAIATALFLKKKFLIFDEPTSGLDYDNMIRVSELLKELKNKVDLILVITHDTELIDSCAEYIIDFNNKY